MTRCTAPAAVGPRASIAARAERCGAGGGGVKEKSRRRLLAVSPNHRKSSDDGTRSRAAFGSMADLHQLPRLCAAVGRRAIRKTLSHAGKKPEAPGGCY